MYTAFYDVRSSHAVIGAGLVHAGLATAFAASQDGRVPHAHELRLQLQPAHANGRPAVPGTTAPAAPVVDRHHRQYAHQPIPTEATAAAVPAAPVRSVADGAPAAAVRVADDHQLPGVAAVVVVLRVARHQPVDVRRQRDQRRHHQTAVGRSPGDRGSGQDGRGTATTAGAYATGAIAPAARQAEIAAEGVR